MFSPRMQFLIKNGLRGLAWLVILLFVYFFLKKTVVSQNPEMWNEIFYARPLMIYLIYFGSEFFFGIIPPELFMIWAINKSDVMHYILNVTFFAIASYALGYLTFQIGKYLHKRVTFRYVRIKFLKTLWPQLKKYGIFLIIVAALTPIPWSGTCLLVGSAGYPTERFLRYAVFRIIRFAVYGYIVFQTH